MLKSDINIFIYRIKNIIMDEKVRIAGIIKIKELRNQRKNEYNINPVLCLNCNSPISYEKKRNKFCCSSCAAKLNNKNRSDDFITEEFRKKQKQNAINFFSIKKTKENEISYYDIDMKCPVCEKSLSNEQKMRKRTYCSNECRGKGRIISNETRKKISDKIKERVKNGTHKGWQSRNIESYPETFFKKVLESNNIKYEFNKTISKRSLGLDCDASYFLDFYIEDKNIDLEIDGKQHNLIERTESDEVRDNALIENGYDVYRIKWMNINTKKGKIYIKEEIEKLIKYIE